MTTRCCSAIRVMLVVISLTGIFGPICAVNPKFEQWPNLLMFPGNNSLIAQDQPVQAQVFINWLHFEHLISSGHNSTAKQAEGLIVGASVTVDGSHVASLSGSEALMPISLPPLAIGEHSVELFVFDISSGEDVEGGMLSISLHAISQDTRSNKAEPSHSYVSEPSTPLVAGRPGILRIHLHDKYGNAVSSLRNDILNVKVTPPPLMGSVAAVLDSAMEMILVPEYAGKHEVTLTIHETNIQGSPFTVYAMQHSAIQVNEPLLHSHVQMPGASSAKKAVVSLVSSDTYVPGALVLLYSLSEHGNVDDCDKILLITDELSQSARSSLTIAGWILIQVDTLASSHPSVVERRWRKNLTKLKLWGLTDYQQVLFLDADTVVLNALDPAWECNKPLCACLDFWLPIYFNTGVMVILPDQQKLEELQERAPSLAGEESEQTALNILFHANFGILDPIMNMQKHKGMTPTRFEAYWKQFAWDIRVLHYFGRKPWTCSPGHDCMRHTEHYHHDEAYSVWWQLFDSMCKETGAVVCGDPRGPEFSSQSLLDQGPHWWEAQINDD